MSIRSLVLLSFVAAFSLAPSARADVPNPTTGSGGSTSSSTTAGAGGAAAGYDPSCNAVSEAVAGSTCKACDPTSSCSFGSDYNLVCQSSAKAAVYCNGPKRTGYSDQNVACSVSMPGGSWGGAAVGGALAFAAAVMMRRRRRA